MEVRIAETGQVEHLEMFTRGGIDYFAEFANGGVALSSDPNPLNSIPLIAQVEFSWWHKVALDNEALEWRINALKAAHDTDVVVLAVRDAGAIDLEGRAAAVNRALDEAFGAGEGACGRDVATP